MEFFKTQLDLDYIKTLKRLKRETGQTIAYTVNRALLEYFRNHNITPGSEHESDVNYEPPNPSN